MALYKKVMELRKRTGWGRRRIAKELGLSENTVGNWIYSKKGYSESKSRKYHRVWDRKHRLTTTGHRRLVGNKRSYPEYQTCELCKKKKRRLLDYHHYDDNDLSKGLWLCRFCHVFAEMADKGFTVAEMEASGVTRADQKLLAKYNKLKSSVLTGRTPFSSRQRNTSKQKEY